MSCVAECGEFWLSHVVHAAHIPLAYEWWSNDENTFSPTKADASKATKYDCEELENKFMGIFSCLLGHQET